MCKIFNRPPPLKKGPIDLGDKPFIDSIQKCKLAVEELSFEDIIAVDCEWAGPRDIPRAQDLCLLQIANAKERAYLFDICIGGKAFFDKGGLKELLENPKILKIFHDCRWDSDILWHQMGVKLQNVFDTQVGYACYRRQQESFTPLPVGLKSLVKRFALGGTHTSKDEAKEDMDNKEDYWKIRPLTELMLQYAREDVLLLPLVYRQINAIFSASSRTVALKNSIAYVSQKREKSTEELQKDMEQAKEKAISNNNNPEGGTRFVPLYGIPEWDKSAMNSLQRMNRRNY
jgi:ribonuclease D